jgi:hypothetical protein
MATRKPGPKAQFSPFLSRFSPEIVALVKRCLPKIRRAIPCPYQLVYEYSNSLVVAFSMSERGYEAIVALAIFPRGIRLYFDKSLPDPRGLLMGSGTKVRSVTIKAASDLDHADIQALFKAAIKRSEVSFPKTRSTRMVIKSTSTKKEPRRTAHAQLGAAEVPLLSSGRRPSRRASSSKSSAGR